MTTRREFIKTASLAGGAVVLGRHKLWGKPLAASYFAVNDFIESHPDAVFVLRTSVDVKTNAAAIKDVGYHLGKTLFVAKTDPLNAYPVLGNVAFKPNITSWSWDKPPTEQTMGIQTDPSFVEGVVNSLQELSVPVASMFIREANFFAAQTDGKWYGDMAQRTGVNLKEFKTLAQLSPGDIQWVDVPNGVWYKRIPYYWPVNAPGTCLINIAKFKSHLMGMTLCSKNLQGTNARPYVAHCSKWGTPMSGVDTNHVVANAFANIKANYDRHKAARIPRWATLDGDPAAGASGGLWQETHASRCLDNNSVLQPAINIIEGVYGREGPFVSGPDDNGGFARDIMTNVVIFGKNARHVDSIGTYLSGHEPGNFGLFHLALERGLSRFLNPRDIPLYEWKVDGTATVTPLDQFPRTPIRTPYLPQSGEDSYHLVNQPFDYAGVTSVAAKEDRPVVPDAFAIEQNFPNPFNPSTSIQYTIPKPGSVRLEIFDVTGEVVDVLVDGVMTAGDHLQVWNSASRASGTYFYRLSFDGVSKTKSMLLVR
jgi:uncharacterized protein (DUF362 family)